MQKYFDAWNEKKKSIQCAERPVFFMEREIWLCHVGLNVGSEQDGKGDEFLRPVLVLRKFGSNLLWIVPLTKVQKAADYYFEFSFDPPIVSVAILSQIKLIDVRRLKRKIGMMPQGDFEALKQKFRALLP